MARLQDILNTIKRNTLDRTNIDEKIGGFLSNAFNSAKNTFTGGNQPLISPLSSKVENNTNWNEPVVQPKPTFKTEAANKLSSRLDQIKRFGSSAVSNAMDDKGIVRQGQFTPLAPIDDAIKAKLRPTAVGQFVTKTIPTAINERVKGVQQFGTGIGKSVTTGMDANQMQEDVKRQKAINDITFSRIKALRDNGDEAGAARLLDTLVKQNASASKNIEEKYQTITNDTKQGQRDLISGAVKTAEVPLSLYAGAPKIATNVALSTVLGGGISRATGEGDPYVEAGKAANDAFGYTGITSLITNPVIEKVLGASKVKNILLNQILQRTIGAGGNIAEDNLLNVLDKGQLQDKNQNIMSGGIGAITSGNDQLVPGAKKLFDRYALGKESVEPSVAQKFIRDNVGRFAKTYNKAIDDITGVSGNKLPSGDFVPDPNNPARLVRSDVLAREQVPTTMMGAAGGIEVYKDENGQTKVRFNPERAATGMAVMGGLQTKTGRELLQNTKIKNIDDILSNKKQQFDQVFEAARGAAQVAAESRAGIDENLITKIKRLTKSKAFQEGDVETLLTRGGYKDNQAISDAVEQVRVKLNDPEMSMGDALDYIAKLPNKADMTVKIPPEAKQLKKEVGELNNGVAIQRDEAGNIVSASAQAKPKVTDEYAKAEGEFNKASKEANKSLFAGYRTPAQEQNKNTQKIASILRKGSSDGLPEPTQISMADKKETIIKKIKNTSDYLFKTGKAKLESLGANGKEAAARLERFRMNHAIAAGTDIDAYNRAVKGLSDPSIENVNRYLDGQPVKLTIDEKLAAEKVRPLLNAVADRAKQVNIQIKDPTTGEKKLFTKMENYLPHSIDTNKLAANRDLVIQSLTPQLGGDTVKASNFVDEIINGSDVPTVYKKYLGNRLPARFGNLEMSRVLDLPKEVLDYKKSLLPEYFNASNERIAQSKEFGSNNELLDKLLTNIETESGQSKAAKNILYQALNLNEKGVGDEIASNVKQFQAATKMGTSFVGNAGQTVNTATKGGVRDTVASVFKFATGGKDARASMRSAAVQAGNTTEQALKEIREGYGNDDKVISKITAPFFGKVEEFNRIISTDVGKKYVTKNLEALKKNANDKLARRALESIGMNPDELLKTGLTDQVLRESAYKFDKATQFTVVGENVPPAWNTPVGRIITQFKSFSYKQAGFIKKEVFDEARKGNIAPLARYIALGTIVGEGINDIKAILTNKDRKDEGIGTRVLDNISAIGGAGLTQDAIKAFIGGDYQTTRFLAGPTGSDVLDAATAARDATQGKFKNAAKFVTSRVPIVGRTVSNTVFPSQSNAAPSNKTINSILDKSSSVFDTTAPTSETERQSVKDQITEIGKARTKILESNGVKILGKQLGGKTDAEKNQQLNDLDVQEQYLKNIDAFQAVKDAKKYGTNTAEGRQKEIDAYAGIAKIAKDDTIDQTVKDQLIEKSGISKENMAYYVAASDDATVKAMRQKDLANTMKRGTWLAQLEAGRTMVGNKQIVDNATLDALYESGDLSDSERDYLKAIKYDPSTGKTFLDRDYKNSQASKGAAARKKLDAALETIRKNDTKQTNAKKSITSYLSGGSGNSSKTSNTIRQILGEGYGISRKKITQPSVVGGKVNTVKRKYKFNA